MSTEAKRKATPLKIVDGQYVPCEVSLATHVKLHTPGPFAFRYIPVVTSGPRRGTPCWTWNGSTDKPTLRPSVRTSTGKDPAPDRDFPTEICHSWITNGQIKFLGDCTHEFKGTTQDLLDVAMPTAREEDK